MTKEELAKKIESYCSRITYINDCFEVHKLMITSQKDYLDEINEFPAFFQLSKKSFIHICIIELAKLYEYKSDAGIEKLIHICDANQNLFQKKIHNEITECGTDRIVESYDISIDNANNKKGRLRVKERLINAINHYK